MGPFALKMKPRRFISVGPETKVEIAGVSRETKSAVNFSKLQRAALTQERHSIDKR